MPSNQIREFWFKESNGAGRFWDYYCLPGNCDTTTNIANNPHPKVTTMDKKMEKKKMEKKHLLKE